MTSAHLHQLLEDLEDTRELVLHRALAEHDPELSAWRQAAAAQRAAYRCWCERPGPLSYAAYLSAADQADAAVAVLQVSRPVGAAPGPHAPRPLAA